MQSSPFAGIAARLALASLLLAGAAHAQQTGPTITTTAFPPGVVGAPYSLQLTATGGTPPYRWNVQPAIVTLPVPGEVSPGLLVNLQTGLVSGTPTAAGTFTFTLTLTDSANGSSNQVFQLSITPPGPLGISTTALPGGTVGVRYAQTLAATGGTPPYRWAISAGTLPGGLSLNAGTGVISGTPSSAGTASLTVSLSDTASPPGSVQRAISLAIVNPAPLVISTVSLRSGYTGAPYQDQVSATGGVPPYRWSLAGGSLPAGLTLDAASGAISGRPTAAGTSSVTIAVADSGLLNASARQTYPISIAPLTPVTVAGATLADATAQTAYSATLSASGGAPPYAWSVVTGTVPPGLYLTSTGTLQGVATAAGAFTFNARATDTAGGAAAGYFIVNVRPAAVSLPLEALPPGMVGVGYPAQVVAPTGGAAPYSLSVSSGQLPGGITLTEGRLQGTPTVAGSFNFNITATDSSSPARTVSVPLSLTVRAAQTELAVSAGSVSFALFSGASTLPAAQYLQVTSTSTAQPASYSVAVSPAVPWLTVSGATTGSTPTSYSVTLSSAASALAASATPYRTAIVFTCTAPAACAGSTPQSVAVNLTVTSAPPLLSLTTSLVSLTSTGPGLVTGSFGVRNAGGGNITVTSVTSADSWLAGSAIANTLGAGDTSNGVITVNPGGFAPGSYRSSLTISTSAGTVNLPVTLLVVNTGLISLNPGGQLFQMGAGGAVANPAGSFAVAVQGGSTISFSAALLPGSPWLTLRTTAGTATPAAPGTISFTIDSAAAAALTPRAYYGTIRVSSDQVVNSPQDFLVVLNVGSSTEPVSLEPAPGGLVFQAAGTTAVAPQTIQIFAASATAAPYQAAASTASGRNWLSVTPLVGSARSGAPGVATVSVSQSGLSPGIYRGAVTHSVSPASVRTINVTLVVQQLFGGFPTSLADDLRPAIASGCTTSQLVPTSGFASDFSQPVAWPVPLVVQLANNCGGPISDGQVVVTFSGSADPPLALRPDPASPGRYFGTWTPRRAAAQFALGITATAPGLPPATIQVNGKVLPNSAPVLTPQSTSNVFSAIPGGVAPGTAVQIYGSNLAPAGTSSLATALPFPTSLAGTSVIIGGKPAPLYFVSPGQINALVPYEVAAGSQGQLVVNTTNGPATPDTIDIPAVTPGIAAFPSGVLITQRSADFSLVLPTSPAKPGEGLIIYLAGLGATNNQPVSGTGAPAPPTDPRTPITLTLNGNPIETAFVGLTPGAVGLYQVNFTLPADTPDGDATLRVTQGTSASNVTLLPVRK